LAVQTEALKKGFIKFAHENAKHPIGGILGHIVWPFGAKGSCSFKSVTGWVIWNSAKSVSFLCLILNLNMVQIADKYFNVTYCNYLYDKAHWLVYNVVFVMEIEYLFHHM